MDTIGDFEGLQESGLKLGEMVGLNEGDLVGFRDGSIDGSNVGSNEGSKVGSKEGSIYATMTMPGYESRRVRTLVFI